ncbi:MAG: hypothetical protein GY833_21215 [Aestuariibacter sp.]|nr:hypothetical protein [Aestuariibacter sp.]
MKGKRILYIVLCIAVLAVTYVETTQAEFYVIPVVRQSAPTTTPCANDGYEVLSDAGRCWMAFNLGATQVATSIDDEAAFGDLYQWGRARDGHQRRNLDPITEISSTKSETDDPGHGYFISKLGVNDWRTPKNDFLWQGISGINNPCPQGFRLPTAYEWCAELSKYSATGTPDCSASPDFSLMIFNDLTPSDLFNSPLKLVSAGNRQNHTANIDFTSGSFYWSSTIGTGEDNGVSLGFGNPDFVGLGIISRSDGASVRCIKN